jgi:hypothetical protein
MNRNKENKNKNGLPTLMIYSYTVMRAHVLNKLNIECSRALKIEEGICFKGL